MSRLSEYQFALYHDTGFPHSHDGGTTEPSFEGDIGDAAGMGQPSSTPSSGGAGQPGLPPGAQQISENLAYAPNPATGGVVYYTRDPYTGTWNYQAGATQPQQVNVSVGNTADDTRVYNATEVQSIASQPNVTSVTQMGYDYIVTFGDGSTQRFYPSAGGYRASAPAKASAGSSASDNTASVSSILGSTRTGVGTNAAVQTGPKNIEFPNLQQMPGNAYTFNSKGIEGFISPSGDPLGGGINQVPGVGPVQVSNPYLPNSNVSLNNIPGGPPGSNTGMAYNPNSILSAYGFVPSMDPLQNAAAALKLMEERDALIAQGRSPAAVRDFLAAPPAMPQMSAADRQAYQFQQENQDALAEYRPQGGQVQQPSQYGMQPAGQYTTY